MASTAQGESKYLKKRKVGTAQIETTNSVPAHIPSLRQHTQGRFLLPRVPGDRMLGSFQVAKVMGYQTFSHASNFVSLEGFTGQVPENFHP